jgi:FkbM family methyltransferase
MPQSHPRAQALAPTESGFDSTGAVDAETDVGPLWLDRDSEQVTPELLEQRRYQPALGALLRRALRPGMTFVDAGANVGYFSVLASRLVGPEGRVVCIEPDARNVQILRANLSRNGCANAVVMTLAAWSESTDLNLMTTDAGGALSRVGPGESDGETIAAERLSDLIEGRVDYLKVDCESTDHMVVSGAEALVRANPSMLITVEFHTNYTGHTGVAPDEVLETYRGLGLSPFRIRGNGSLKPASFESILSSGPPDRITIFDFALSARVPDRLAVRFAPRDLLPSDFRTRVVAPILRWGGDMLEHLPEPIRPAIRPRDRRARALAKSTGKRG